MAHRYADVGSMSGVNQVVDGQSLCRLESPTAWLSACQRCFHQRRHVEPYRSWRHQQGLPDNGLCGYLHSTS